MFLLKYWHFTLFFIGNVVFADDNSTRQGRGFLPNLMPKADVNTQYHLAEVNGLKWAFCQIGANSYLYPPSEDCKRDFKKNNRLSVLIHGFSRNYQEDWIRDMTDQLTKMPNTSVIVLNWAVNKCLGGIAPVDNTLIYRCAFDNIGRVIDQTSEFLSTLTKQRVGSWDHVHILGHSMGAHIAGKIAETLKTKGIKVNRVTGLDPALPCFKQSGSEWSLKKSHADFVDVIHTNSRPSEDSTFGLYRSHGHVDIYPNDGDNQPGCSPAKELQWTLPGKPILNTATALFTCEASANVASNLINNRDYMMCNHFKAPEYMILSMKNQQCDYMAVPMDKKDEKNWKELCKSGACVKMGINAAKPSKGKNADTRYYIDMTKLDASCRK